MTMINDYAECVDHLVSTMNTTSVDLRTLKEEYIELIIDELSVEEMKQMVTEQLEDNFDRYSLSEMKSEIETYFGEDTLNHLIVNNSKTTK